MSRNEIISVLLDIQKSVTDLREEGESDLRSVIFIVDDAISKVSRKFENGGE